MSKVLITGGSGFIGTNLITRCQELGYELFSIDILSSENDKHTDISHICDINNYTSLSEVFTKFQPDYVIHLAARTDLRGKTLADYESNIGGVVNLCRVISEHKSVKKAIFASSMLVCEIGYKPDHVLDYKPSTIYGESKVKTEEIIRNYTDILPDYCIVRPTSIWGPYFKEPYKNFFDLVLSNKFFHPGTFAANKTYGYVENTVNQILSLILCDVDLKDEMIYLGDEPALNISNWANEIADISNVRKPLVIPFLIFQLAGKLGDFLELFSINFPMTSFRLNNMTSNHVLDCSLVDKLNKTTKKNTKEGIIQTVEWINNKGIKSKL